jgi:molecular chaperone GrpE (heat shock protein)
LLGQLARLDEVRDRLDEIQNSIEQHATGRMQRERELSQRLDRILAALLLLLDYLEEAEAGRHAGCDIGWVRTRLTSILRDVDIDELPVQIGQPFQSDLHRLAGQRPDPSPPGSVLEVTRNGYWRRAGSERAVVRAAEVIVSSGSVRVGGEGTGQEVSSHG